MKNMSRVDQTNIFQMQSLSSGFQVSVWKDGDREGADHREDLHRPIWLKIHCSFWSFSKGGWQEALLLLHHLHLTFRNSWRSLAAACWPRASLSSSPSSPSPSPAWPTSHQVKHLLICVKHCGSVYKLTMGWLVKYGCLLNLRLDYFFSEFKFFVCLCALNQIFFSTWAILGQIFDQRKKSNCSCCNVCA